MGRGEILPAFFYLPFCSVSGFFDAGGEFGR
jgi:hypothetical protein